MPIFGGDPGDDERAKEDYEARELRHARCDEEHEERMRKLMEPLEGEKHN